MFPTTPCASGYSPVAIVKWFGKVTEGKLGSMYLGEMPSATNLLSVGVRSRYRKSARKPSKDINMVVGAKSEVPLDTRAGVCLRDAGRDTRYAAKRRITKRATMLT